MLEYLTENIFEVEWHGPYNLERLSKYRELNSVISLYALYGDHPLYGRKTLTYIGKAVKQSVQERLRQHDLDEIEDEFYVASIRKFNGWKESNLQAARDGYEKSDYIREGITNHEIIDRIEELLIYALWPAGNIRNKNTASKSWHFRLFNTGALGLLPPEISGHYTLEHAPDPSKQQALQ